MERADIMHVSRRTVTRLLNANGYKYLQARKKGLISERDRKLRVKFAKHMIKDYAKDVWQTTIAFYFDAVGFVYKRNPRDQALAPSGKVWRTTSEGLVHGCTAKGQACGTGGNYVKLCVAISYDKGVICSQKYEKMDGKFFAGFLLENFEAMVLAAGKNSRVGIQDNDPSQNSGLAKEAMKKVGSDLLSIPPRSPDMNPIENVFSLGKKLLQKDAIEKNITAETKEEFEQRIINVLNTIPIETINNIINSMDLRMHLITRNKEERLKY